MKYIKVVIHNRPSIAQSVATHLRAGNVDQNDPTAVRDALISFLDDTAAMARLMTPATDIVPALAVKADPRKHTSDKNMSNRKGKPPSPCYHCGQGHWGDVCDHPDKGSNKYRIRQLQDKINELKPTASPPAPANDDKLAQGYLHKLKQQQQQHVGASSPTTVTYAVNLTVTYAVNLTVTYAVYLTVTYAVHLAVNHTART
jgi:hypothetical protein